MLQLSCDIQIGKEKFDYVNEVSIVSAWKNLTDTAVIKLPRKLITRNNLKKDEQVKVGDGVTIKLGYNFENTLRFKGYVESIGAATGIVEIKCQDEMWKLKQGSYTKSWPKADVNEVVSFIKQQAAAKWNYEVLGDKMTLGHLMIEGLSGAKILQKLKDDFGIYAFFRGDTLTVGKPYDTKQANTVSFQYGVNVISWRDLEYKSENDVRIKVKLVNTKPDGTKEESIKGDTDGEERTLHFYNLTKAELDKQAEAILKQMKYSGYRGKFLAFGEPMVKHGDVAFIQDRNVEDRAGKYYIDGVETTFSPQGMRQLITLGPKAE